ncbi:MAG: agmatine deiminase family protein, partial [Patescibacteria group bacterium]
MSATKTPKQEGFRMPAEWEPHSSVWLSWPYDPDSFPHLEEAEGVFADFVKEIAGSETVELQIRDRAMQERSEALLRERGADFAGIRFHEADYADIWFRDYGPTFVVNRKTKMLAMTKWTFNAWGGKYAELLKDDNIPHTMNARMGLPVFEPGIVLEGGSIDVNGQGTVMTTEQCLLNRNRNPHLTKKEIEEYLNNYLGCSNVLWL